MRTYTGFDDLSGNKIHEGDIVRVSLNIGKDTIIDREKRDLVRYTIVKYGNKLLKSQFFTQGFYLQCVKTNEWLELFGITKIGINKNLKYFTLQVIGQKYNNKTTTP